MPPPEVLAVIDRAELRQLAGELLERIAEMDDLEDGRAALELALVDVADRSARLVAAKVEGHGLGVVAGDLLGRIAAWRASA